jgi:hypothetical protein
VFSSADVDSRQQAACRLHAMLVGTWRGNTLRTSRGLQLLADLEEYWAP